MTIDPTLLQNLLGWFLQGSMTVGLMILAAKAGLFPHVIFVVDKPQPDPPNRPKSA